MNEKQKTSQKIQISVMAALAGIPKSVAATYTRNGSDRNKIGESYEIPDVKAHGLRDYVAAVAVTKTE